MNEFLKNEIDLISEKIKVKKLLDDESQIDLLGSDTFHSFKELAEKVAKIPEI